MAKANFDDFRNTLLSTINFVTEKVLDLADAAADTAKTGHEIAKLLMEGSDFEDIEVEFDEFFGDADFESVVNDAEAEADAPEAPAAPSASDGIADAPDDKL